MIAILLWPTQFKTNSLWIGKLQNNATDNIHTYSFEYINSKVN